jgi:hypothetical protein
LKLPDQRQQQTDETEPDRTDLGPRYGLTAGDGRHQWAVPEKRAQEIEPTPTERPVTSGTAVSRLRRAAGIAEQSGDLRRLLVVYVDTSAGLSSDAVQCT